MLTKTQVRKKFAQLALRRLAAFRYFHAGMTVSAEDLALLSLYPSSRDLFAAEAREIALALPDPAPEDQRTGGFGSTGSGV